MKTLSRRCAGRLGAAVLAAVLLLPAGRPAQAGVREDLLLLRNRALTYSAGYAPFYPTLSVLSNGLYAQSPFSTPGEIDLAASGFALAGLPACVQAGILTSNAAKTIAGAAASRVLEMVQKSAAASTPLARSRYGYAGMLYHYATWSPSAREFHGNRDTEVSSIDTTLLLYGLLACAEYFGEPVRTRFRDARGTIRWRDWLDRSTLGFTNQFYMSYTTNYGLQGHWDFRSDETTLLCLLAAAGDTNLDAGTLWSAWQRRTHSYTSAPPESRVYSCYASWNGDPFTDFYALLFLDTRRLSCDFAGVDWFENNRASLQGHAAYFARERGYLRSMTTAFVADELQGVLARPAACMDTPPPRTDAALYSIAGGLPFYSNVPDSNAPAQALSWLVRNRSATFGWHGWPIQSVVATDPTHPIKSENIVGQDICAIGLSIDNFFTNRLHDLVMADPRMAAAIARVFPVPDIRAWSPSNDAVFLTCSETITFAAQAPGAGTAPLLWTWSWDGAPVRSTNAPGPAVFSLQTTPELLGPHIVRVESRGSCDRSGAREWLVFVGDGDPNLLLHWSFDTDGRDLSGWGNEIPIQNDATIGWDGVSSRALDLNPP